MSSDQQKDPKTLRYESKDEWRQAEKLEHMADETIKSDPKRYKELHEAADELREDSERKWDESKK